ncbi:MAG: ComF family protein [Christensenella sp.]
MANKFLQEMLCADKKCVYCGREISAGTLVCDSCAREEETLRNAEGFAEGILFAYRYEGVVRSLIHRYKYNDTPRLAPFIAQRMAEVLDDFEIGADLITFVPIHEKRLKVRGFDQTEMLAYYLNVLTGVPCERLLVRTRDTKPQYKLNARERWQNVHGAFALESGIDVCEKNILLLDDVYTTGVTISECMQVLAAAGANVMVMTYAKEFTKKKRKIKGWLKSKIRGKAKGED